MRQTVMALLTLVALAGGAVCCGPGPTTTLAPMPTSTLTVTSPPAPAWTPETGSLAAAQLVVRVYDAASGQPVPDARVVAFQMLAYYVEERTTDATGRAAFQDLKSLGTTMITVEADGYDTFLGKLEIVEGANSLEVNVTSAHVLPATPVPRPWIDAHTHLNPDLCQGDLCGIELLVSSMSTAGISGIVLFPLIGVSDSVDVLRAYRRYPDLVIPFRGPDGLDLDDPTTLNLIRTDLDAGHFRGLGEIVTRHGFYGMDNPADHPVMLELWRLGREYGIPVTVHMGTRPLGEDQTDIPAEWLAEFERALYECPSTTFIWAHSGPSRPEVLREVLDRHPNLYADLSALNPVFHQMRGREHPELLIDRTEWIRLLEAYPDRFLFGTDVYFLEGYVQYSALVTYVRDEVFSQLSADTVAAISHGNAERLFGITPSPE